MFENGRMAALVAINGLIYTMGMAGLGFLFWDSWSMWYRQIRLRRRYRLAKKNKKEQSAFHRHIYMVL